MGHVVRVVGGILLGVGIFGMGVYSAPTVQEWNPWAQKPRQKDINVNATKSALGRIQPAGGVIQVMGQPGDLINKVLVKLNAEVKKGERLVDLASYEDRQKELKLAEAQLEDADKQVAAIKKAREAKLRDFDLQVLSVEADARVEADQLKQKEEILGEQARAVRRQVSAVLELTVTPVSTQERDKGELAAREAEAQFEGTKKARAALLAKITRQKKGSKDQRESIEADFNFRVDSIPLASLKEKVNLTRVLRDRAKCTSPVEGSVFKVFAKDGDTVGPEPLLQLVAGKGMVVVAEVAAKDIDKLREWMAAHGKLDALVKGGALGAKELKGSVTSAAAIARGVARNAVVGFNPRGDSDRRVVEVQVVLSDDAAKTAADYIGLDVEVFFSPPGKP